MLPRIFAVAAAGVCFVACSAQPSTNGPIPQPGTLLADEPPMRTAVSLPRYPTTILANAPALYLRLGDRGPTAVDSSGHGRNAALSGARTGVVQGTAALVSQDDVSSTTFTGNDRGRIAGSRYAALEPAHDLSIEVWERQNAAAQSGIPAFAAYGIHGYRLGYDASLHAYTFALTLSAGRIVVSAASPADALPGALTHHLVGTYDGSTAALYIDGTLAATQRTTGDITYDIANQTTGLVVGNDLSASAPANAVVAELALYAAALSPAAIANHYALGTAAGNPTPTWTPTNTPTPSSSSSPTPVPIPTRAPTPTPAPTHVASPMPTHTPSSTPTPTHSPTPTPTPSASPKATTPFVFIVGQPQIDYLDGKGGGSPAPTPDPYTASLLNGTHPYALLSTLQPGSGYPASDCSGATALAPVGWQANYMIRFTSEAEEETQLAAGGVPACVTWIMYDNEPNTQPSTPQNEQLNPPLYMLRAAYAAHAHGKKFMATAGDGVPSLLETLYSFASQYDAYDEQIQTGECPTVSHFVDHLVSEAANFQRYNPTITITAGFGDAVGTNCANGQTGGPPGILEYVPPSYVDPFLEALPSNVAGWGNYGAKTSGNNGGGTPAYYGDWSTTVRATVTAPARTPLPIPAPTPANTNTPIPSFAQLRALGR